jgi:hypothetical protein
LRIALYSYGAEYKLWPALLLWVVFAFFGHVQALNASANGSACRHSLFFLTALLVLSALLILSALLSLSFSLSLTPLYFQGCEFAVPGPLVANTGDQPP